MGNKQCFIFCMQNPCVVDVYLHNDVVDGNVDEFDKESDESHDTKSYGRCYGNLLKL
jgi:hypothetical protein